MKYVFAGKLGVVLVSSNIIMVGFTTLDPAQSQLVQNYLGCYFTILWLLKPPPFPVLDSCQNLIPAYLAVIFANNACKGFHPTYLVM